MDWPQSLYFLMCEWAGDINLYADAVEGDTVFDIKLDGREKSMDLGIEEAGKNRMQDHSL
ncbi:hypothetical protein [Altericista sp. CCNU0014]|uniref:hypothetical protein n=1 Tax=Altericista sp. CCNU0014 TaxID=3082949 RepID=UPI00384F0193